jgi:hypothetical protein
MVFALVANSQAEMVRVICNAWTNNFTDPNNQNMQIQVYVTDSKFSRAPDFVKSITVKAPDGTLLGIHPTKDWLHLDNSYQKNLYASDFPGKKILGGRYWVTVTPISGLAITEYDDVPATFLLTSSVTFPANGATGVIATPKLTWTAPAGATYYRLRLWDNSMNEPVYWWFGQEMRTDLNFFNVPPGVLQPNRQYKFRIEARASSSDLDMRSNSDWVTFTTGTW